MDDIRKMEDQTKEELDKVTEHVSVCRSFGVCRLMLGPPAERSGFNLVCDRCKTEDNPPFCHAENSNLIYSKMSNMMLVHIFNR